MRALDTRLGALSLRVARAESDRDLAQSATIHGFGGEIVFVVDLDAPPPSEDSWPSSAWADFEVL